MPRTALTWGSLAAAVVIPLIMAAASPLLAWRQPVYIIGGFAGIAALAMLLLQPLLAGRYLPLNPQQSRRIHRVIGMCLVAAILLHVVGLWITSPPDMIDALTFTSPTPFSAWGVIAMWTLFAAALVAGLRRKLRWRPQRWRWTHATLAAITVGGSIVHAMLIEGAMETVTKTALCTLVLVATLKLLYDLRKR